MNRFNAPRAAVVFPFLTAALFGLSGCDEGGQDTTGGSGGSGSTSVSSAGGASGTGSTSGNGGAGGSGGESPGEYVGYHVNGRFLHDRCGEKVVLRGVNEMIVWSNGKDGEPEFAEIAKTGANAVRIVWLIEEPAAGLDQAIQNALAQKLIPIVELHNATGDLSKLPDLVNYWTKPDVVAAIKKHEQELLVNIGNEVGDNMVSKDQFETGYKSAITAMRGAGIRTPLVIDGSSWGQDIDMLQATGPALIAHDPDHNVLLSVHMWWTDGNATKITNELNESVQMNLPLIVGEFAQHAVYQCAANPFDYKAFLAKAQELDIGWLAWSWGGVENGDCKDMGSFDMTVGGVYGNWKETWGEDVAVKDANSIKNTSVRPVSMVNGACK